MSRAAELLAQYESKIGKVGQWIAIRRYTGTTVKTYARYVLTRAYIRYEPIDGVCRRGNSGSQLPSSMRW